jgi:cytochrome d ubiquinol oxidase subunit II
MLLNTIGPVRVGNEVWLLTAGGQPSPRFPHWYATMFSGLYLPLLIILVALIVPAWASTTGARWTTRPGASAWDAAIFLGSAVPALPWEVALTNVVMGLPIDAQEEFTGRVFTLLNPAGLLGGLTTVAIGSWAAATVAAAACWQGCSPRSVSVRAGSSSGPSSPSRPSRPPCSWHCSPT